MSDYADVLENERFVYENLIKWHYDQLAKMDEEYYKNYYEYFCGEMENLEEFEEFLKTSVSGAWMNANVVYVYFHCEVCVKKFKAYAPDVASKYNDEEIGILLKRAALVLDAKSKLTLYELNQRLRWVLDDVKIKEITDSICWKQLRIKQLEEEYNHPGNHDSGSLSSISEKIKRVQSEIDEKMEYARIYFPEWYIKSYISDFYFKYYQRGAQKPYKPV